MQQECQCLNFVFEQYEKICTDCGRIYENNVEMINYDKKYSGRGNTSSSYQVSEKFRVTAMLYQYCDVETVDDELFNNIKFVENSIYKGNNKKALTLFFIFNRFCETKQYDKILNVFKDYTLNLFLKSKKIYKKLIENEVFTKQYVGLNDLIYFILHYGKQTSLDDVYILNCLENSETIFKNDITKCNIKTTAICILYNGTTTENKIKLNKLISFPTLKKILKLI